MLSHWKQGAQNWHITKTVNFVKPANFFKNRLRSLEPARNKGFINTPWKFQYSYFPPMFEFSLKVLF